MHSAWLCVLMALFVCPPLQANDGQKAATADETHSQTVPSPALTKRLLVLDPTASDVKESTVQIVSGLLTVELAALGGFEVISGNDVRRMMDLEAQKVNLGCSVDSCLTEIADAFGTDLVVFGNIGRLGELYVLTLNLFETATAKSKGRISVRTRTIEELPAQLSQELPNLMASVRPLSTREPRLAKTKPKPKAKANPTQSRQVPVAAMPKKSSTGAESRGALLMTGGAIALAGLAGVAIGLVPLVQHELAVQDANEVKQSDWGAYQQAQDASERALDDYETWGLPVLGLGGAALWLGGLLGAGVLWLAQGEMSE